MSGLSIHKAALEGQPGLVRTLLNEDPKLINAKDDDGRTPLHWAATTSNLNMIQLLLSNQPELETKDQMGWTALMVATASGHHEIVRELLEAGADVNATNEKGQTSLHYAASKGNVPVSPLRIASHDILVKEASAADPQVGRLLISKGADVGLFSITESNADIQINARDRASQFPLHRAATTGSNAFLRILLNPPEGRPKTRLNGPDRAGLTKGNTPLHLAMESGHGDAAVVLIEAGADREREINSEGQTPEEIDGVGGQEQKNVRKYVESKVGPRKE